MNSRLRRRRGLVRKGLGATGMCAAAAASLPALADETTPDNGQAGADVVVTARRTHIGALPQKIQNTAQSINILPRELMQQQGVTTLQEALKNVPGVTLNSGEGGSHGDSINLRGFPASDDFFLDGQRDTGFYTRDDFDIEAIEVYKGPASTLFGRGSTGGVINQVSKQPLLHSFEDATVTVGNNNETRATADIDYAFSDNAAFRLNAMAMRSNVIDRDYVLNNRWGIAPSLALGVGGPNTLTLDYLHQQQDDIPDYGIPFVAGRPAPVARTNFYGLVDDDRFKTQVDIGTAKFVHTFSDDLALSETVRVGDYWFDARETAPHYDPGNVVPPPTAATPLDQIMIYRDRPSVLGMVATQMSETELTYKFATGPLHHTLVAGFDLDRESADLVRFTNQISSGVTVAPGTIAPTPLLDPDPFEAFPGRQTTVRQRPDTETDTVAGFLVDSIDVGPQWNLVGAIRLDRFHAHFDQPLGTASNFDHVDVIPSPRVAVVYKPIPNASLYFSYGTSFDPSAENLSLSAANHALPPEMDRTFEVGAKGAVLNGRLALTAAVFDTTQDNSITGDPTQVTQVGNIHVDGFELGAAGYLTDKWEITAGYTYLTGTRHGTAGVPATPTTAPVQNMAPNQFNLWSVYEFTEDFQLGFGVNYLDRRPADIAGKAFVPAYVTLDAMASYRLNRHVTLQLNAYNLTDALYFTNSYFSSPTENHVVPGAGRTVTLTALFAY